MRNVISFLFRLSNNRPGKKAALTFSIFFALILSVQAGLFSQGMNHGLTSKEYFIDMVEKAPAASIGRLKVEKKDNIIYFKIHRHTLEFDQKNLDEVLSYSLAAVKRVYFVSARCGGDAMTPSELTDRNLIGVLYDEVPGISKRTDIEYARIVQTGCQFDYQAAEMFHGFIFEIDLSMMARRGGEIRLVEEYFETRDEDLASLMSLEGAAESIILKVFNRNPQWKNMLIITDVTGSMTPYVGQLIVWHRLNLHKSEVKHFVFFNDGDATPDHKKEIGKTGGIYTVSTNVLGELRDQLVKAIGGGSGGDTEENDLEAVLQGIKECPTCTDIVLIADNNSPMRDYSLLKQINKPIKIIVCGSFSGFVNLQYLELARATGGSVHTMEEDLTDLMKLKEGETLQFGRNKYIIKDGKFELVIEPKKEPKKDKK